MPRGGQTVEFPLRHGLLSQHGAGAEQGVHPGVEFPLRRGLPSHLVLNEFPSSDNLVEFPLRRGLPSHGRNAISGRKPP